MRKVMLAALVGVVVVTGAITLLAQADVLGKQGHHVAAFALGAFACALLFAALVLLMVAADL